MKKKILAAVVATALCAIMVGCSGGSDGEPAKDSQKQDAQAANDEVVLVDSGWSATNGYIMYGVVLENKSDKTAEFPTVQITAKDASGAIISSDDAVLCDIQPGQKVAFGSQAGNGEAPASVEFSLIKADFTKNPMNEPCSYQLDGVSDRKDSYGGVDWVGQITNTSENDADMVNVSVILYKDGAIVGGYSGYVDALSAGMTQSFDVMGYDVPEYDAYETYAMTWL